MVKPSSPHAARQRTALPGASDGRLSTPTFRRNNPPMVAELSPWLRGQTGPVLEIGAGTGEHATAFALAFPTLDWWPSDPDPVHRASVSAWQKALNAPKRPPIDLDASSDWPASEAVVRLGPLRAVLSMNVVHIAPFDVARGIISGAGRALASGGMLFFYGPFMENGVHTGAGNEAFDRGLKAENPEWGVRDTAEITALAAAAGLRPAARIMMPADNRLLVFTKN